MRIMYVIVYVVILAGVVFCIAYVVVNYSSFSNENVVAFVELVKENGRRLVGGMQG